MCVRERERERGRERGWERETERERERERRRERECGGGGVVLFVSLVKFTFISFRFHPLSVFFVVVVAVVVVFCLFMYSLVEDFFPRGGARGVWRWGFIDLFMSCVLLKFESSLRVILGTDFF